ncbi:hypothetical protein [Leucobacter sp. M11]|uniref:hypothetical protein n=1 Tax=Leucobacter sp. M11 TaxID=2993565 RepID=UPI002D80D002|nr:hypothetical protein [Leucobacter sp. M11]MEB4614247.1 hypothetical protein [Leucobacter sp. M11]
MRYRGLTWDHPRGEQALRVLAAKFNAEQRGDTLEWDTHPLEGFESAPIAEVCAQYHLVVLDHPHLGDALESGSLRAITEAFAGTPVPCAEEQYIGASVASYTVGGQLWALPLDAATQVAAYDPEWIASPPREWNDVEQLAREAPVALSLAGPHALISWYSVCGALGAPVAPDGSVDADAGAAAYAVLARLAANSRAEWAELNPIAMLELMSRGGEIAYAPLIYGYVNYARPKPSQQETTPRRVAFADAPRFPGRPPGSTLGGTGLAVTAGTVLSPALAEHLAGLVGVPVQSGLLVDEEGQPARREAWLDSGVARRTGSFTAGTAQTLSAATVRPRFPGYTAFQSTASALFRSALLSGSGAAQVLRQYDSLRRAALAATGPSRKVNS